MTAPEAASAPALAPVADFFARYAAAFEALDGDAVAALYGSPCGLLDRNGYTHWAERAQVLDNMRALCALYRQRGLVAARPTIVQWMPQGDFAGYADVRWTLQWQAAVPDARTTAFHTGYLLHRAGHDWRIQLCTAYQET